MERAYLRIAYKLWKKGYSVEQCMEFLDVKEEALIKMYQLFSQYPEMDIQQLENVLCNRKFRFFEQKKETYVHQTYVR
ncbi:MAG: hypothetical protein IIT46_14695 [Lachnospiraceae bacterium]|nr:hypothetical protein [Lachnospiraceae bacterium]